VVVVEMVMVHLEMEKLVDLAEVVLLVVLVEQEILLQ
jgi:hypothetical protein